MLARRPRGPSQQSGNRLGQTHTPCETGEGGFTPPVPTESSARMDFNSSAWRRMQPVGHVFANRSARRRPLQPAGCSVLYHGVLDAGPRIALRWSGFASVVNSSRFKRVVSNQISFSLARFKTPFFGRSLTI